MKQERLHDTWEKGPFTYAETIIPGVVHLYDCGFKKGAVWVRAPQVESTLRLSHEEVESRFADFRASTGM